MPYKPRERTEILVTHFSLSDIQWLIKNHSCFAISFNGFQGQIDNYYTDKKYCASALPLLLWLPCTKLFFKAYGWIPLNIYRWWNEGYSGNNKLLPENEPSILSF